jgi:hypothetical protein
MCCYRAHHLRAQKRYRTTHHRLCRLQLDDWRLAVGCADGIVQVADLRRGQLADGKLQAHAVLPAHGERVSDAAVLGIGSSGDMG